MTQLRQLTKRRLIRTTSSQSVMCCASLLVVLVVLALPGHSYTFPLKQKLGTAHCFMMKPVTHSLMRKNLIHPLFKTNQDHQTVGTRLYQSSASMDEERDFVKVPRRRRGRRQQQDSDYYDEEEEEDTGAAYKDRRVGDYYDRDYDYDEEFEEDEDEDDDEDGDDDVDWDFLDDLDWEEEGNDLFENTVIPNPLLDSIDPDGAADRFPELAQDPRFWIDMVLFIAFLNFLSAVGPRDPFPDIPWY